MESLQSKLGNSEVIFAQAVGRRKEAVAKVQLISGTGEFIINNKPAQIYLQNHSRSLLSVKAPFEVLQNLETSLQLEQINIIVKVEGGGLVGQAEAIKLAVARAVCRLGHTEEGSSQMEVKKSLKTKGLLTVDARVKERRKYGLKKARKASQYHKR